LNNNSFYYYYIGSNNFQQLEDKGVFSKDGESTSVFIITSELFDNEIIELEDDQFEISIDGTSYVFKKFHVHPIINLNTEPGEEI